MALILPCACGSLAVGLQVLAYSMDVISQALKYAILCMYVRFGALATVVKFYRNEFLRIYLINIVPGKTSRSPLQIWCRAK